MLKLAIKNALFFLVRLGEFNYVLRWNVKSTLPLPF